MMRRNLLYLIIGMSMMFPSCQNRMAYSHYESTPVRGWECNDTLLFDVPPIQEAGYYEEVVGLRINGDYPFMGLDLVVRQMVLPSQETYIDTLVCNLADEAGHTLGRGVNHYQYQLPLTTLKLNKGDSLHITIHHCMKREILPGISDVGLELSRQVSTRVQTKENK